MEERLQHQPTALEPQRAHTNRVRSSPQGGAKLEQTLLMIEGKLGSRSQRTCAAAAIDFRAPVIPYAGSSALTLYFVGGENIGVQRDFAYYRSPIGERC